MSASRAATTVSGNSLGVMSAWTVSVGTRSRRQISGSACSKEKLASWLSATERPPGSGICRLESVSSETRSSSTARATTLTR